MKVGRKGKHALQASHRVYSPVVGNGTFFCAATLARYRGKSRVDS